MKSSQHTIFQSPVWCLLMLSTPFCSVIRSRASVPATVTRHGVFFLQDLAKILLTQPVCTQEGEKIALSRRVDKASLRDTYCTRISRSISDHLPSSRKILQHHIPLIPPPPPPQGFRLPGRPHYHRSVPVALQHLLSPQLWPQCHTNCPRMVMSPQFLMQDLLSLFHRSALQFCARLYSTRRKFIVILLSHNRPSESSESVVFR